MAGPRAIDINLTAIPRLAKGRTVKETRLMATAPEIIEERVLAWPAARRIVQTSKPQPSEEFNL